MKYWTALATLALLTVAGPAGATIVLDVFPPTLDAGNLIQKYDVLFFPDGAIPAPPGEAAGGGRGMLPGGALTST